jgi:hypothetical protein
VGFESTPVIPIELVCEGGTNMIRGSCHCGAVAYVHDAETPTEATECNCSMCRRKGYLLSFQPAEGFRLETPREAIAVYTFNKHLISHQFCKTCGCAPFSEGKGPDGKAMVAINLRCADGIDPAKLKITQFDGASA